MAIFDRWNWIDIEEFRKYFGYTDPRWDTDQKIQKAIRYGCERVDLESGNTITKILGDKQFPSGLTKAQIDVVQEAAAWCANHMLKQGLEWLRGSASISLGQISTAQTNPEEPDYFPPFLRKKLVGVGLIQFIYAGNIPLERGDSDPFGDDPSFSPIS